MITTKEEKKRLSLVVERQELQIISCECLDEKRLEVINQRIKDIELILWP